jgi:outer membrane receptor protein involved in Fe transport
VELACASEDAPCNLPNAFLADPPLEQVVAHNAELGLRGTARGATRWNIGAFYTMSDHDILFQTTGGPQANIGFFDNAAATRRTGLELGLARTVGRVSWSAEYSLVKAEFADDFIVSSPNHPVFEDPASFANPPLAGDEKLRVSAGARIPGVPRHQGNLSVDLAASERWALGADVNVRSGVYLRGDEANLLDKTAPYTVVNVHALYRLSGHVLLTARIENLFDQRYETFGILGDPREVFPGFTDPRFYGAGAPFGAWLGVRIKL